MGDVVDLKKATRVQLHLSAVEPIKCKTASGRHIAIAPAYVVSIENTPDQLAAVRLVGRWRKVKLAMTFDEAVRLFTNGS